VKVLHLFPPNYAAINRAFKVRGKPIIFCYGSTIYNPGLASPLYGSLVDFERARRIIIGEIPDHGGRCPRNSVAGAI
jgi:hypothetical protein